MEEPHKNNPLFTPTEIEALLYKVAQEVEQVISPLSFFKGSADCECAADW